MMVRILKIAVVTAVVTLTGCVTTTTRRIAPDEAPVIMGSRVRSNVTPLQSAFGCLAQQIEATRRPPISIAVGDVKDYTGKYSQNEGSTITQGGALMVYSALGKLGGAINLEERFDTRIAELELAYMDRRQLGDGEKHVVNTGKSKSVVPWVPYYGGTIQRSNYYIIGGITELNYNISTGGFEFGINNSGIKARTYTLNVGIDLRIVDTSTLQIVKTVSLEKQLTGYEVGAGTYRFFGNRLFDVNIGDKSQEPLQLGVRTVLEEATLDLVGAVTDTSPSRCIYDAEYPPEQREAAAKRAATQANVTVPGATSAPAPAVAIPPEAPAFKPVAAAPPPPAPVGDNEAVNAPSSADVPQNGAAGSNESLFQVPFDFGNPALGASASPAIEKIVSEAAQGKALQIQVIARDSEHWAPQKRQDLTNSRIHSIQQALEQRGIQDYRISTLWTPSASDTGITRDGSGYQVFATIQISKP